MVILVEKVVKCALISIGNIFGLLYFDQFLQRFSFQHILQDVINETYLPWSLFNSDKKLIKNKLKSINFFNHIFNMTHNFYLFFNPHLIIFFFKIYLKILILTRSSLAHFYLPFFPLTKLCFFFLKFISNHKLHNEIFCSKLIKTLSCYLMTRIIIICHGFLIEAT